MDRDEARNYVKGQLEDYLKNKGVDTRKNFRCLNPDHADNNPSMSYDRKRQKAHCFSCGADYDTFDLIGIDYGIADTVEIFKKAYEIFNINVDAVSAQRDFEGAVNNTHTDIQMNTHSYDYTDYFSKCMGDIDQTDYLSKRGISKETAEKYNLGYDKMYSVGKESWNALIIPTGKSSFAVRNTDENAEKGNRYRKVGTSGLYNIKAMKVYSDKPIFIVEGELDALSIIEVGGNAVGLGSTANKNKFIDCVKVTKPTMPLLVCLDNDKAGKAAGEWIVSELQRLGYNAHVVDILSGKKDPNAALTFDRELFKEKVSEAVQMNDVEKEEYLKTSAAASLAEFVDGIKKSVDTPFIPTGFKQLDNVLDGGLFEGLYIFGAISSLGKTTFVTQIADQIAMSGRDVLVISLEMAKTEIMAKSISRLTIQRVLETGGDAKFAKTSRGITTYSRWDKYCDEELQLIGNSIHDYEKYADHIYISEGIGDIGVEEIRGKIQKHIDFTGNVPVVVIDYIQILAPYSERMTDKQNTDRAVMELKRISRDYKLPILGISSLNRDNYNSPISMVAFKESGAIEYSSDVLIGLQLEGTGEKDFDVNQAKSKNPREIELKILKNRNGATGGTIEFSYYPMFNYFMESAEYEH